MEKIKAIILDIEGTITPISFVKDVLFPYSYRELEGFLKSHWEDEEIKKICDDIRAIEGRELSFDDIVATLKKWITEDRKITPLKQIQGLIWEEGYKSGQIKGYIYPDAYEKMIQWYRDGIKLYIYSSGSVKAQKLLFSHTNYGDITYLFSGYFDTNIGSKLEARSYSNIAELIDTPAEEILFISDNPQEIVACKEAQLKVIRIVRENDAKFIEDFPYLQISSFHDIDLDQLFF